MLAWQARVGSLKSGWPTRHSLRRSATKRVALISDSIADVGSPLKFRENLFIRLSEFKF